MKYLRRICGKYKRCKLGVSPQQNLFYGFFTYVFFGFILLCLPMARRPQYLFWIISFTNVLGNHIAHVYRSLPSGAAGGIKITTLTAVLAIMKSRLRGRDKITFLGRSIPFERLNVATSWHLYTLWDKGCKIILGHRLWLRSSKLERPRLSPALTPIND